MQFSEWFTTSCFCLQIPNQNSCRTVPAVFTVAIKWCRKSPTYLPEERWISYYIQSSCKSGRLRWDRQEHLPSHTANISHVLPILLCTLCMKGLIFLSKEFKALIRFLSFIIFFFHSQQSILDSSLQQHAVLICISPLLNFV